MARSAVVACMLSVGLFPVLSTPAPGQSSRFAIGPVSPTRHILDRPTVSPYLNLLLGDSDSSLGAIPSYFTQVRPQLEARERARQQAREIKGLQRQVTSVRNDISRLGKPSARTTGHPTRFMNFSHYYPQFSR
jgi:hypothetical protein